MQYLCELIIPISGNKSIERVFTMTFAASLFDVLGEAAIIVHRRNLNFGTMQ